MSRSDDRTRDSDGGSDDQELNELLRAVARTEEDREDEEALVGTRIGRFVIRGRLGRGGMGVVYRALDPTLGRNVALKVLRSERESDPDRRSRFLREARSAAAVVHPNVATIYEVGDASDVLFIAMELVGGETLRARLSEGKSLPVAEVIEIAEGILRGLAAAHQEGIIHRDLKPENVMIDREKGLLKILDFGLAKLRDTRALDRDALAEQPTDALSTAEGHILGTPAYMSPEQAAGKPLDHRSDLFSLGSLLYETLTGSRPFSGETTVETLTAVIRDAPAPLREVNPDAPVGLAAFVMACLAKTPAARPESANAALATLRAIGDARVAAESSQDGPRPSPKWLGTMVVAVAIVGAMIVAIATLRSRPNAPPMASASASASAPAPLQLANILPSETTSETAREKFRAAMRVYADGNNGRAAALLDAAIEEAPAFASAHLQRAYASFVRAGDLDERARASFRSATTLRGSLSSRDTGLLDALTPAFQDPPDWQGATKRFEAFVAANPADAQAYDGLGVALLKDDDDDRAERALLAEKRIDPLAAGASMLLAQLAEERADLGDAKKVLQECIAASSSALACRVQLAALLSATGECKAADAVARDAYVLDPTSRSAAWGRARAACALGANRDVVAELLEQHRKLVATDERAGLEGRDAFALATREGDFVAALAALDAIEHAPNPSSAELNSIAFLRARTLWEMGEPRKSATSAKAFLERAAVRRLPERILLDETGRLLGFAKAGGVITDDDFIARRETWIRELRLRPSNRAWHNKTVGWIVWLLLYGTPYDPTPKEAADAFAALDPNDEVLKFTLAGARPEDEVALESAYGALLLAAGRLDEAEVRLGYAAHACLIVPEVHALYLLGNLYAKKTDHDRACEAYSQVENLWGHARPRSITAEAARAAAKRIDCRPAR